MKITNIGFVGLGNVGSKVANNILNGGFNLYVYPVSGDYLVTCHVHLIFTKNCSFG